MAEDADEDEDAVWETDEMGRTVQVLRQLQVTEVRCTRLAFAQSCRDLFGQCFSPDSAEVAQKVVHTMCVRRTFNVVAYSTVEDARCPDGYVPTPRNSSS